MLFRPLPISVIIGTSTWREIQTASHPLGPFACGIHDPDSTAAREHDPPATRDQLSQSTRIVRVLFLAFAEPITPTTARIIPPDRCTGG